MLACLLVMLAVLTVRQRFNDPDMWWHLKTGEVIWTTHTIPTTDLFSYTTNHHTWIAHEWLSEVLIYGAYRWGGYSGVMLWLCFFSAALLMAGYVLCSLFGELQNSLSGGSGHLAFFNQWPRGETAADRLSIVSTGIDSGVSRKHSQPTMVFRAAPVIYDLGELPWVILPWTLTAGLISFLLPLQLQAGIASIVSLESSSKTHAGPCSISLSGSALPQSCRGETNSVPLNTMLYQPINLSQVEEWKPLQWNEPRGIALLVILGCIFLLLIIRLSELFWHELLLLTMGTWFAISHERMAFVFGILAAPVLSRLLSTSWDGYNAEEDRPWPNAALIATSLLMAVLAFPGPRNITKQIDEGNPVKAVEFIKTHHLSGHMLNAYVYGGYLIWALPEQPVFFDGRGDLFEWSGLLGEFAKWTTLQSNPSELLDKYGVDFCLLNLDSPMARVLPLLPGWKVIYSDKISIIVARSAP